MTAAVWSAILAGAKGFLICYQQAEEGNAQLEAQSTTSATSTIAKVALHINFLF